MAACTRMCEMCCSGEVVLGRCWVRKSALSVAMVGQGSKHPANRDVALLWNRTGAAQHISHVLLVLVVRRMNRSYARRRCYLGSAAATAGSGSLRQTPTRTWVLEA